MGKTNHHGTIDFFKKCNERRDELNNAPNEGTNSWNEGTNSWGDGTNRGTKKMKETVDQIKRQNHGTKGCNHEPTKERATRARNEGNTSWNERSDDLTKSLTERTSESNRGTTAG